MFGLSTSWRTTNVFDGDELLDAIKETGIDRLEIDYRIQQSALKKIKGRLQSNEFNVLSVHAICPMPDKVNPQHASAELFDLSSEDIDEHRLAINASVKTLELAADLEASIVVIHLGSVKMNVDRKPFFQFYEENKLADPEYKNYLESKLTERHQHAEKPFDRILKGIDKIHEAAHKLGILVGIENRYFFNQIPFDEEFDILFNEFDGGNLRYWHDVGHAEVFHRLKFLDHKMDLLERYKKHLGGMHIHDISGLEDHLSPGLGDFDFEILKDYLNDDIVKILEIHEKATTEDIINGFKLLENQGIL